MRFTALTVMEFAKQAADDFLRSGDLNGAVAKIAAEHELSPTQIQRVVEAVNHEVNGRLYKQAKDRRFVFDMADQKKVLELLKTQSATPKTAATLTDFFTLAPRHASEKIASATHDLPPAFRSGGAELSKRAVLLDLQECHGKAVAFLQECKHAAAALRFQMDASFADLVKEARRLMREESVPLQTMWKMASAIQLVPQDMLDAIFTDLKTEFAKSAARIERQLLPLDLEDKDARAEYKLVDGSQPIFIHLRALAGDALRRGYGVWCGDSANTLTAGIVTAIHVLRNTKDVKEYIERDVAPFANNMRRGVKFALHHYLQYPEQLETSWIAKQANIAGVLGNLEQASRLAQVLNQTINLGERGDNTFKGLFEDLLAPFLIRPEGIATSMTQAKQ